MTGLDASVMLRLMLGQPADQAARAVALLDELSRSGRHAVVSDLVVAEAYFALQHHYDVSKKDAVLTESIGQTTDRTLRNVAVDIAE